MNSNVVKKCESVLESLILDIVPDNRVLVDCKFKEHVIVIRIYTEHIERASGCVILVDRKSYNGNLITSSIREAIKSMLRLLGVLYPDVILCDWKKGLNYLDVIQ